MLPPLNLEEDEYEEKNKEVVILDVDGRISLQEDGDEPYITTDASTTTGRIFVPASNEQDQEQPLKKQINPSLEECTRCRELHFENRELKEALEKSSPLTTAGKMVYTFTFNNDGNTPNDVLPFEFSMLYRELQYHLAPLHSKIGDHGKVWFSGKINKNTGIVVSSNLGRIEQQQQDECIDIANRDDLQNE